MALKLLQPGRWYDASELANRTIIYPSGHAIGNALGRLRMMGFVELRKAGGHQNRSEWKLTDAGVEEIAS